MENQNIVENDKIKLIDYLKLLSGRLFLTIVCSIAFLMFVYCICNIMISKCNDITFDNINSLFNVMLIIISNVITFYFSKSDKKINNEQ